MVALLTEGSEFDKHGLPFRRRHVQPALYTFIVLIILAAGAWGVAFTHSTHPHQLQACNPPPSAPDGTSPVLGTQVAYPVMALAAPARLADTKVEVLNASGRAGQAATVADALRDLGFAPPSADNDPLYSTTHLDCQGQIRFGEAGQATAAALWLVAPCMELYRDDRPDDLVQLVIGTDFTTLAHSSDIDAALSDLRPDATNLPTGALLTKIHSHPC